jgi:hypothetical protein
MRVYPNLHFDTKKRKGAALLLLLYKEEKPSKPKQNYQLTRTI